MENQDNHRYDDIINLPNPTSKKHPRMSLYDRAAQFSPFAALTGHEAAIKETARQTDEKLMLSDEVIAELNEKLLVSNAEFKIFNIDKNEYVKQYTTYPWVVRIVCVGCYNRLCRLPESFHKCIFPCII